MPIPTESWVAISAASTAVFSKDGSRIFHLRGAGLPQVWVMDLDGGNAAQLSHHDEKVGTLRRAPTDDRLIWSIDAGGDELHQLWLLEPGGAPRALTTNAEVMHNFGGFSPDGTRIAYSANDRDPKYFDAVVMDLASGGTVRLHHGPCVISVAGWSPDGARIAVIEDHGGIDQRVMLVTVATGAVHEVPRARPTRYQALRWTPAGELWAITDAPDADFLQLCRIDEATGAATPIFAPLFREVEAWSLSPDGAQLATIENDRGYATLRVGAPGTNRPAIGGLPEGIVAELAWKPDSTMLVVTAQGPTNPASLYAVAEGRATRLALPDALAPAGLSPEQLVPMRLIEWVSFDGTRIPAFYATPKTPAPPGGYPAVMWIHGGPSSQTRANFRPDTQMLLDQGFAVLLPNMRGSTGYGRAYMEADELHLRAHYVEDMASGRAWMAAQPEIDANRIGVMGQSYGGWAVNAAIAFQPELWKAAVNYYGLSDFETFYRNTSAYRRDHRAREYGFPGIHDAVIEQLSPIRHVDRVTTPTLFLHGDRDPRVPMSESDAMVAAMAERQKKVAYEKFEYAGHGFIRPDHRRRVYAAVAAYFHEHL